MKIGTTSTILSSSGNSFCSVNELFMFLKKGRCLLTRFLKKFAEISSLVVAFLLSRFKVYFLIFSGVTGLKSNISGTESFSEFTKDEIFIMLV